MFGQRKQWKKKRIVHVNVHVIANARENVFVSVIAKTAHVKKIVLATVDVKNRMTAKTH